MLHYANTAVRATGNAWRAVQHKKGGSCFNHNLRPAKRPCRYQLPHLYACCMTKVLQLRQLPAPRCHQSAGECQAAAFRKPCQALGAFVPDDSAVEQKRPEPATMRGLCWSGRGNGGAPGRKVQSRADAPAGGPSCKVRGSAPGAAASRSKTFDHLQVSLHGGCGQPSLSDLTNSISRLLCICLSRKSGAIGRVTRRPLHCQSVHGCDTLHCRSSASCQQQGVWQHHAQLPSVSECQAGAFRKTCQALATAVEARVLRVGPSTSR